MNNMNQISLAMFKYEQIHRSFPPAAIEKDGKPLLSWRVAILPYLEEDALYKQFHLDEPWDSPHNLEVAKKMPAVFQSPDSPKDGKTRVMLFTGKGAAFDGGKKVANDGHPRRPVQYDSVRGGRTGQGRAVDQAGGLAVRSREPVGGPRKGVAQRVHRRLFRRNVHQLKVDNKTLKALITPDGGEVIDMSKVHGGR